MVMLPTNNFRPSSRHRDEVEVYLPHNTLHSTSSSEFPHPETNRQQPAIYFSIPEQPEIPFPFIPQITLQRTHKLQQPPNYEGQFLGYATPFGTIPESIQQELLLPNFDAFPNPYRQFEQFNGHNEAAVWNRLTSEYLFAPNNTAGIPGEISPVELNATEDTRSFSSNLAPDIFSLQLPFQSLEAPPSLEDNLLFNEPTLHMPMVADIQSEVPFTDTEPLDWNWQWDQTREPQIFSLPCEYAGRRSKITPAVWPPESQSRSSSDSTQPRLVRAPTAPESLNFNSFVSSQRPLTPRFLPIHFQKLK